MRPPKKSWKNISNLSGGEKTLSSLSLVFALHHFKPTPLYVMDEIDAALGEQAYLAGSKAGCATAADGQSIPSQWWTGRSDASKAGLEQQRGMGARLQGRLAAEGGRRDCR